MLLDVRKLRLGPSPQLKALPSFQPPAPLAQLSPAGGGRAAASPARGGRETAEAVSASRSPEGKGISGARRRSLKPDSLTST